MTVRCPFCDEGELRCFLATDHWFAIDDAFPLTTGHALLIPKRHVAKLEELVAAELDELMPAVRQVLEFMRSRQVFEDFNLGLNDGPLAGQTVPHLHLHLIPRRKGDTDDPRGGVRFVIPAKARYWEDE